MWQSMWRMEKRKIKRKCKKKEMTTKNKKAKKTKRNRKRIMLGKRSHIIQKSLKKKQPSSKSPTIGAFTTWLGLLTNQRTVGFAWTKVKLEAISSHHFLFQCCHHRKGKHQVSQGTHISTCSCIN